MGLDITAYSRLKQVGRHTADWCEDDSHVSAYAYSDFPRSFRGIPVLGTRTSSGFGGAMTFLEGGCYELTSETEVHAFRAGSYGGYNQWRADLQEQFNPGRDPDGPFYELIWFADNEGSIGPDAARDLLTDFEQHAARYDPPGDFPEYARGKYADWMRACALAADGGLVRFH
jgi:hypothetical protein